MENDLETGQQPGTGTPPASPASGQGSAPSIDVEALARALEPTLEKLVDKKWQSGKDTRIGKLTSKVEEFQSQLERLSELKKDGFNEQQALRFMKMEEQVLNQANNNPPAASAPVPQVGNLQQSPDVETLVQALDLDANDAEVTEVIRRGGDLSTALIALKAKRIQAAKAPPNPAAIVSPGGGATPQTDLMAQYKREVEVATTTNERLNIRMKYRKLGLPL